MEKFTLDANRSKIYAGDIVRNTRTDNEVRVAEIDNRHWFRNSDGNLRHGSVYVKVDAKPVENDGER